MYRFPWDGVSSQFGPEQTREKDEPWANSQRPKPLAVHSGAKPWVVKLNYDKFKCRSPGNIVVISKSRQKECKNYQSLKHMSIRQFCQWEDFENSGNRNPSFTYYLLPIRHLGNGCQITNWSRRSLQVLQTPFGSKVIAILAYEKLFLRFSSSMRNLKNGSEENVLINFHFQPCVCIAFKRRHITLSHSLGFLFQPYFWIIQNISSSTLASPAFSRTEYKSSET